MLPLASYRERFDSGACGIPQYLQDLDPDFFVVRNHMNQSWEVHHSGQDGSSFCLLVPYAELDYRTVVFVRQNMIERAKERIAEIERQNALIAERNNRALLESVTQKAKEIHAYASRHESRDAIPEKEIEKFLK